MLLHQPTSKK